MDLAYYRRLLHGIVVSEIDGKWGLFWAYARQYLRKAGLDKVLDYKIVYKRVEYNAGGRRPFIDVFAVIANEKCTHMVPVGVEVKASRTINVEQVRSEVSLLPNFMSHDYNDRYRLVEGIRKRCGAYSSTHMWLYILIVPGSIVKRVDELVRLVKSGMGLYGDERFFKHTVIPLEGVVSALSVKNDLAELVNQWDLITLGRAN